MVASSTTSSVVKLAFTVQGYIYHVNSQKHIFILYIHTCTKLYFRYNVADSPVTFDSDYMVFVSPPPKEKSKAVAPYMPFDLFVSLLCIQGLLVYLGIPK